jgi:hypothetical protein
VASGCSSPTMKWMDIWSSISGCRIIRTSRLDFGAGGGGVQLTKVKSTDYSPPSLIPNPLAPEHKPTYCFITNFDILPSVCICPMSFLMHLWFAVFLLLFSSTATALRRKHTSLRFSRRAFLYCAVLSPNIFFISVFFCQGEGMMIHSVVRRGREIRSFFQSELFTGSEIVLPFSVSSIHAFTRKPLSRCLYLLPRLPVTSVIHSTRPSITCFRKKFLCKMCPIELAFLLFSVCMIFIFFFTPCNASSFLTP